MAPPDKKRERKRRHPYLYGLLVGLAGLGLGMGLLLYDSGAHAAWAEAQDQCRTHAAVRRFHDRWPASTVGGTAHGRAVQLLGTHALTVAERLIEAARLQRTENFDALESCLNEIQTGDTPGQKRQVARFRAYLDREKPKWAHGEAVLKTAMAAKRYSEAFQAYQALKHAYPIQSRLLEFPIHVQSFPSQATLSSGHHVLGTAPRWLCCLQGMDLTASARDFFDEPLKPLHAWTGPEGFVRLKPEPAWLVRGGGPFSVQAERVYLLGADRLVRCLRLNDGRVIAKALLQRNGTAAETAAVCGKYLALGAEGKLRLFHHTLLRAEKDIPLGDAGEAIWVGPMDDRSFLAGGARTGVMVLSGESGDVVHRFPGAGPVDGFTAWGGGQIFATGGNEVMFVKKQELMFLGQAEGALVFAMEKAAGCVDRKGGVQVWDDRGMLKHRWTVHGVRPNCVCARYPRIAVSSGQGDVVVLSVDDGRVLWQKRMDKLSITSLVMTRRKLVIGTRTDGIYCVSLNSGAPLCHIPAEGPAVTAYCDPLLLVSDQRALAAYRFE